LDIVNEVYCGKAVGEENFSTPELIFVPPV
jgi:hypothetical protein